MTNSNRALTMMRGFAKRLKAARVVAGYETGDDFAVALGINPPRYRKYELKGSYPPLDVLERISARTGKSLDFLLRGIDCRNRIEVPEASGEQQVVGEPPLDQ